MRYQFIPLGWLELKKKKTWKISSVGENEEESEHMHF